MRRPEASAADTRALAAWCDGLVADGSVDAVAVETFSAATDRGVARARAGSYTADGPPIDEHALFDLASLTKPWTATLALWLDRLGDLPLATRVGDLWEGAADPLAALPLDDLLRHRAGFVRWRPLYATCGDPDEALGRLLRGDWLGDPRQEVYSDLDFLLWGLAAESATGSTYGELVRGLADALGAGDLVPSGEGAVDVPVEVPVDRVVACGLGTGREVELAAEDGLRVEPMAPPSAGVAQDGNVRFFGRPMGHAGLFAPTAAMARLGREWLEPGAVLSPRAIRSALDGEGRFALGWFRGPETEAGRRVGARAIGHDGFTGGSIWLDPDAGRGVVMLAHRASLEIDLGPTRVELVERAGLA